AILMRKVSDHLVSVTSATQQTISNDPRRQWPSIDVPPPQVTEYQRVWKGLCGVWDGEHPGVGHRE
ncbi:MAG: hypothetical protein M3308_05940, partial [Actinomycetota bacterium]|nr:hypothetical protein [Actinomycetota bacterium]